jgi:hypothetical protein
MRLLIALALYLAAVVVAGAAQDPEAAGAP